MSERIRNFLSSLADLDQAKKLVTPDVRFIAVREQSYDALSVYGAFEGYDGLVEFVSGLRAHFDTQQFHIDASLESEELGYASGRFEHRIRTTGRPFVSHWAVMCEFRDGKIALYRFYEDNAALEEAMGSRTECKEEI